MQPAYSNFPQPPPNNPNLHATLYSQPPNLHPSLSLPQTQFPIQQPTPSVPFAALSDPNKFLMASTIHTLLKNFPLI